MILRRRTLTVAALLAAALVCWIAALRGMSTMGGLGPFVGVWVTTMAAVMLPSAVPMVLAYAGLRGGAASTGIFVTGYLAVWAAYGLAAYAVGKELPDWSWLGPAGLILAGSYQLTPLKEACLRRCRAPVGFLVVRPRRGRLDGLALGLEHGAWCAGCCAGLMVALFALGMMSLPWMAAAALLILAEKTLPGGERLAWASGVGFVAAGAVLLL